MLSITSFFDENYQTPRWLSKKLSRRSAFKAAGGALALTALPSFSDVLPTAQIQNQIKTDPWLTLDAVLNHLLPASPLVKSDKDISAQTIQATQYLMNVVALQPTEPDEVEFIFKGVGWLNGYTQSQKKQSFIDLNSADKETMLKAISRSGAGQNWLNNLIGYLYEAMLSPPIYGGNPNGVGWKWLEHQPGYPLPKTGGRFYELPAYLSIAFVDKTASPTLAYSPSAVLAKRNKA